MSVLSENVENLFDIPPDVKNSLNDDYDAMTKGFKLVFPLASPGNCHTHVVVISMP